MALSHTDTRQDITVLDLNDADKNRQSVCV